MKYEIKTSRPDPFDLACSDCEIHYIDCWEDITLEELRQLHAEQVEMDDHLPDWASDEMAEEYEWKPTIRDFDEWLRKSIEDGDIRVNA